jgi:hypothetical protein
MQAFGDALAAAQFSDAALPAQTVQHNADFFSAEYCLRVTRRMSLTSRSDDGLGLSDFWLISTLRWLR